MALNVCGLYLMAWLLKDGLQISGLLSAIVVVLVYGFISALVRPLIFVLRLMSGGINMLTLGLWSLVISVLINALLFFALGMSGLIGGFKVRSFSTALYTTVAMSIINVVGNIWLKGADER
jgi:uncharacterized membrane protein YvlD (DUF360 family)